MKKIDVGQILAILANLGVIGGLVFVGMQLQQDREIAVVDRMQSLEENFYYWAELVNSNEGLWARGLAGEELSPSETVQFDALASARQFALFSRWFSAGRNVSANVVTRESFLREAAIEIASNPGFLSWWRTKYEYLVEIDRADDYDESLNAAIDRVLSTGRPD
ncbi:MAG: hypothetical protein OEM78_12195 [Gammaproteobacteria bacterium]|nr:hypothetical protein [Gammaproteobacteria bacterium]